MSIAFLFPGQGAQRPGCLHRLPSHRATVETLEEAGAVLGRDPLSLDSSAALESTDAVQLALLIAGVATARVLAAHGLAPASVAGHSVGAYGAAVCAQALEFADALRLVSVRAHAMAQAYPERHGLAAIVGLTELQVRDVIQEINEIDAPGGTAARLYLAAINAPRQLVIAGADAPLDHAMAAALQTGAHKVERLAVRVPSHCVLMAGVAERLRIALQEMAMAEPEVTYVCNHNARAAHRAAEIREDLILGVRLPVLWHDSTRVMKELGARIFLQMAPGHALRDLAAAAFMDSRSEAIEGANFGAAAQSLRRMVEGNE